MLFTTVQTTTISYGIVILYMIIREAVRSISEMEWTELEGAALMGRAGS